MPERLITNYKLLITNMLDIDYLIWIKIDA